MRFFTPRRCPRLLLLLAGLAGLSCSDEFATDPTRVPTVTTVAAWRDTMASKDVDTVEIQVTLAGGRPVAGVETRWAVSDTSIVQLVPILDTVVAAGDSTVVEFRVVRRALRRGHVTLTVLVDRPGVVSDTLTAELTVMERWIDVSLGEDHMCAINADSIAYCWGNPLYLGRGTTQLDPGVPGRVRDALGNSVRLRAVRSSSIYSCGIRVGGSLVCWGDNVGQFGDGPPVTFHFVAIDAGAGGLYDAVAAGSLHLCAVHKAYITDYQGPVQRAVRCFGVNDLGQLGCGAGTFCSTPALYVVDASRSSPLPVSLSAGESHSCAAVPDYYGVVSVSCWGSNLYAQATACPGSIPCPIVVAPGDSSPPPSDLQSVAAGANSTCGLDGSGIAYCWGLDYGGLLGAPPDSLCDFNASCLTKKTPVLTSVRFAQIAVGGGYGETLVCGLTALGAAYCWGDNGKGQLGNGGTTPSVVPVPVVGGHRFSMLSLSRAAGYSINYLNFACGITIPEGAIYCWGRGPTFQQETSVPVRAPEPAD